jgi:predicted membrane-bound spermidine synthase
METDMGQKLGHTLLFCLIFITGGVTLALEVLASKIMSPYFGVSLFIWAGILSITLAALAAGYWWGGFMVDRKELEDEMIYLFLLLPAWTPLWIIGSRGAYPELLPLLSNWSLVGGSFVACLILLALPLVFLSAMNPVLIALLNVRAHTDGGSGTVFAVSTLGSVLGVIFTAFVLIPQYPNSQGILLLGLLLGLATIGVVALFLQGTARRRKLLALCSLSCVLCLIGLLLPSGWTVSHLSGIKSGRGHVVAEVPSFFGLVKVIDVPLGPGMTQRLYIQDGLFQSIQQVETGESLSPYNYALVGGCLSQRPEAKTALVLGLAGGGITRMLVNQGLDVDVVEIDPKSVMVAEKYFGFDSSKATVHLADARLFVRNAKKRFDLIIVDLFHAGSTADYLLTREFFGDLRRSLNPGGIIAMNTTTSRKHIAGYHLLKRTLMAEFPFLSASAEAAINDITNVQLFGSDQALQQRFDLLAPAGAVIRPALAAHFLPIEAVDVIRLDIEPATDDNNPSEFVFAPTLLEVNQATAKQLEPDWQLN